MNNTSYAIVAIIIMAAITLLLRVLPFAFFSKRKTPKYIEYLGEYLPYAIIGMLVVYCLKDISFTAVPFGIPEIISIFIVVVLHIWKRNTLLSIVFGTVSYMLLIHFI